MSPKDVVLVAPGTLPKTSSGKLQRSLCRDRYLDDLLTTQLH
jgi:fatty-acyl-CoA synthase